MIFILGTDTQTIMQKRSVEWYRGRVKTLRKKPQPVQRTPEWFALRNTRVTASEAASCLPVSQEVCQAYIDTFKVEKFKFNPEKYISCYDTLEDYVIKKCLSFFGENVFKDSVFTLHGKKFEEIATRLYRRKLKTDVIEFGFLPHSRLGYIGASPDGITPDGVMLEIKCPYSRKIQPGTLPIYYWVQIMIQLETCDLDQCDFLECEIINITKEEFDSQQIDPETQELGILLNDTREPDNSETKYIYPPANLDTPQDYLDWAESQTTECTTGSIVPNYYFIKKWYILQVFRNKEWFELVKPIIKKTHALVSKLQNDPVMFEKYKQSVHLKKNKVFLEKYHNTSCLIDLSETNTDDLYDEHMKNFNEPCLINFEL